MGGRWSRRRVLAAALVSLTASGVHPASPATAAAEADLAAAQRRANQAAAELSEAESQIARAEGAVAHQQGRVASAEQRLGATAEQLRQIAIREYVGGSATSLSRLFGLSDATELVRAQQYGKVIAGGASDSLGRFRAARDDLRTELAGLQAEQDAADAATEALRRRQAQVVAEVERLARVVAEQRAAAERAAQRARAAAPAASAAIAAAVPATGGSAAGWICPVNGPRAFSNDFGAPRAGGRSHQGNDLLAPRGTPVVAHVPGVVVHRQNGLGGLAYFLNGDDGNSYYGAHLDSYGASGRVAQGAVVGTVGDSGDARGGPPHLHFEMKLADGRTINPYSRLVQVC